jgi:hypothetical protein
MGTAHSIVESPCSFMSSMGKSAEAYCADYAQEYMVKFGHVFLDLSLGSFVQDGVEKTWSTCLEENIGKEGFGLCVSRWSADRSGIPTGGRSFGSIVQQTFVHDILIAGLLLLFVVFLPLIHVCIMMYFSWKPSPRGHALLRFISSWSMMDVLVVALLITCLKSPSVSIYIEFGFSGMAFVAALILIKVAQIRSERLFVHVGAE